MNKKELTQLTFTNLLNKIDESLLDDLFNENIFNEYSLNGLKPRKDYILTEHENIFIFRFFILDDHKNLSNLDNICIEINRNINFYSLELNYISNDSDIYDMSKYL